MSFTVDPDCFYGTEVEFERWRKEVCSYADPEDVDDPLHAFAKISVHDVGIPFELLSDLEERLTTLMDDDVLSSLSKMNTRTFLVGICNALLDGIEVTFHSSNEGPIALKTYP
jgi:hypothetical protein